MLNPDMPKRIPMDADWSDGWHSAIQAVDDTLHRDWGHETAKRLERMGQADRRDLTLALAHGLSADLRHELAHALLDY